MPIDSNLWGASAAFYVARKPGFADFQAPLFPEYLRQTQSRAMKRHLFLSYTCGWKEMYSLWYRRV